MRVLMVYWYHWRQEGILKKRTQTPLWYWLQKELEGKTLWITWIVILVAIISAINITGLCVLSLSLGSSAHQQSLFGIQFIQYSLASNALIWSCRVNEINYKLFFIWVLFWNYFFVYQLQSVSLTAAPFFLIAGIWFVLFGLSLAFICLCYCCCRREPYGYSRMCYALSLIFLIFFTISAM